VEEERGWGKGKRSRAGLGVGNVEGGGEERVSERNEWTGEPEEKR
jgi:hypothetical protein